MDAITLSRCDFNWTPKTSTEILKGVDLHIPEGALVALVGPVASGKSSLVVAMLGELVKSRGKVNTKVTFCRSILAPLLSETD